MSQGTQIRAYSNLTAGWAFSGAAAGTITHVAGVRVLFPDAGSAGLNITNNYGVLINDQTANTGTVTYTNRWGIYQEGASDLNYFAANTLIGTTTNAGYKLDVNGTGRFSGNIQLDNTNALFIANSSSSSYFGGLSIRQNGTERVRYAANSTEGAYIYSPNAQWTGFSILNDSTTFFNIATSGAATFSNTISATKGYFSSNGAIDSTTGILANASTNDSTTYAAKFGSLNDGYRMVVRADGNIGIGTITPAYALDVNGLGKFFGNLGGGGGDGTILWGSSGSKIWAWGADASASYFKNTTDNRFVISAFNNGNVGIGTTTDAGYKLQVNGTSSIYGSGSGPFNAQLILSNLTSSPTLIQLANSANSFAFGLNTTGTQRFVFINGGLTEVANINGTTGVYTALSDFNKKKDFEHSTIGLDSILKLKPTLYRMKTDDNNSQKQLGFIAQEVKEVIPQAFVQNDDFIGLNYNAIIAALVKAVQELNEKIK